MTSFKLKIGLFIVRKAHFIGKRDPKIELIRPLWRPVANITKSGPSHEARRKNKNKTGDYFLILLTNCCYAAIS